MPDWNAVVEYYTGHMTTAAIKASLYLRTLTNEQQTELQTAATGQG